jgi:threonine synthase
VSAEQTCFVCAGCGHQFAWEPDGPAPYSCPAAVTGDDVDHVVRPVIPSKEWGCVDDTSTQPFLRYRHRLSSYHLAREAGMRDDDFCRLVRDLDAAVARVDGRGFATTPCTAQDALAARAGLARGGLWVKDETVNVSGSHKGRHLFGLLLHLRVAHWRRAEGESGPPPRLAIASCGNAALAAAVIARAAELPLHVFVPPTANASVVTRLNELGALLTVCERRPGEHGDPCYLRFREARAAGAIPFCCQGPDNGLTIEGGKTLAWELVDQLDGEPLDRLFLQVGGGAFASACAQALAEAVGAGALPSMPRIHAVQTRGAYPLERAYSNVAVCLDAAMTGQGPRHLGPGEFAAAVLARLTSTERRGVVTWASRRRRDFMRPWEAEPRSVAHGILDDETYDWLAVVEGMIESGGWPVVVSEDQLRLANDVAREATGIDVDHTGSAGFAGLLSLVDSSLPGCQGDPRTGRAAVVFTGRRRDA